MTQKELIFKNSKILYRIAGKGQPVFLIHGFGEDGSIWKNQVEYLKDSFQLIIPDLPGSGLSGITDDMSMEGMADAVKAIWDAEHPAISTQNGFTGICLIGHSMGGYITLAFAEKYPELLNSFGLFHSTAFADSEEKKVLRNKGIEFVNKHGAAAFLKSTMMNLFAPATQKNRPEIIEYQIQESASFSDEAIIQYYQAMIDRPDRTHVLQKSKVPVLFIAGKHDITVPLNDILKQCHLPDISYFHILQKAAHMGMIEEISLSNHILERFLQKSRLI